MAKDAEKTRNLHARHQSRAHKEANTQRIVVIGIAIVGALVAFLMVGAVVNETLIRPRQVAFTVNDTKITQQFFSDMLRIRYTYLFGTATPEEVATQQQGFSTLSFAEQIREALITQTLIEQKAAEAGIVVTDEEAMEQIELGFGYDAGDPEPTSTPAPTVTPTSADPTATSTYVMTLTPTPTSTLEPGVTPTATPVGPTPVPSATPTFPPVPTGLPTATAPNLSESEFTDQFDRLVENFTTTTGIPAERVKKVLLWDARQALLQERLSKALVEVDTMTYDALVGHILVNVAPDAPPEQVQEGKVLIEAVLFQITNGDLTFEEAAARYTGDTNGPRGGELGWLSPDPSLGLPEFFEVVKSLPIGEVSEPVFTLYGWHLIKVYDRVERPATAEEQQAQRDAGFQKLQDTWRAEAVVDLPQNWEDSLPELP